MPNWKAVAKQRWRLAGALTVAMMLVYFGFILLIAFAKGAAGRMIAPGLSVGIVLGASVIGAAWLLTGVYVYWANRRYDAAVEELRIAQSKGAAR